MSSVRTAAAAAFLGAAALCGAAHAQVYRIVGPDGKVTFSDRPPADAKAEPAQSLAVNGGGGSTASLPAEVRKAASQYPATLYTTSDCAPCASARSFLRQRGIPYTERTVNTREDIAALQRLAGSPNLPLLTIGAQQIPGFSDAEWSQYLDAAGYPRTSQLPPSYRNPDPAPLVAVEQRTAPVARPARVPPPASAAEASPPSDGPSPSNPAGIRF